MPFDLREPIRGFNRFDSSFFLLSFYDESNCTRLSQYKNLDTATTTISVAPPYDVCPFTGWEVTFATLAIGNLRAGIGLFYSDVIFVCLIYDISRS